MRARVAPSGSRVALPGSRVAFLGSRVAFLGSRVADPGTRVASLGSEGAVPCPNSELGLEQPWGYGEAASLVRRDRALAGMHRHPLEAEFVGQFERGGHHAVPVPGRPVR